MSEEIAQALARRTAQALARSSARIEPGAKDIPVVLAAGHGKRIKSSTLKMLDEVWGKPSIVRVVDACRRGLDSPRQVVVVGIKALDVARAVADNGDGDVAFAFQPEQNGTGHAVACALESLGDGAPPENIYVFPGDMGLIRPDAVRDFKKAFDDSSHDMMVMTGLYQGAATENQYGRILRVPDRDATGVSSGEDGGKVIEIKEFRDIMALSGDYEAQYGGRRFRFTKDDLVDLREFNTAVYAFKGELLKRFISALGTDNAQGEVYLTDLIAVFNRNGLSVGAASPSDNTVVLGFNSKSVLREMEDIARRRVYDQLKDTLTFENPDNFFIADEVVDDIIRMDRENGYLDITIGSSARIEAGVKLNVNVTIKRHAELAGDIELGEGVTIWDDARLSVHPGQKMVIGAGAQVFHGDVVKGNVHIGPNSRIESRVNVTGSDEFPTRIGANVTLKGASYVFGSVIEDGILIEHSVLKGKHVERVERRDGAVQAVRFYLPLPEGIDCISDRK